MRSNFAVVLAAMLLLAAFSVSGAFAQNDENLPTPAPADAPAVQVAVPAAPSEALTDSQFTYGTVVSVSPGALKISEYDFETDTSTDMDYVVAPDAKMENVNSINEVRVGDEVELEFVVKDGKKTVISVYVE